MESQKPPQRPSLALLPRFKNALRQRFTKLRDAAPRATPQDQEAAQSSQHGNKPAATQFHRFPDLPTELRLQIWSEATRYKRYVVLDPPNNSAIACARLARRYRRYAEPGYAGDRRPAWTSRTPPPTLLSVSREAREVALGTWHLAFGMDVFPAAVVRKLFFILLFMCVAIVPGWAGTGWDGFSVSETFFAVFLRFAFIPPPPKKKPRRLKPRGD